MTKKTGHLFIRLFLLSMLGTAMLGGQVYAVDTCGMEAIVDNVEQLVPIGAATGIKLKSDGVMITGFSEQENEISPSPARTAGLKKGDVICAIDGTSISSGEDLINFVKNSHGKAMEFTVKRGDETVRINVTPAEFPEGYKVGIMVRDSVMGIGTITFYEPESGVYGALGHGISDPESDTLVPISDGSLVPSTVSDVKKGESGNPGELHGVFETEIQSGTVEKNTEAGIYGHLKSEDICSGKDVLPICKSDEVKVGDATILSTVCPGEPQEYDIKILKITEDNGCKDMLIEVTDPDLLNVTGGIVQGMGLRDIRDNTRNA